MKRMFMISALIAAMPYGVLLAQSTPPPASNAGTPQAQTAGAFRIAPGTVIPVQLSKTVDAKKAKTGDEVFAKVTQDGDEEGALVLDQLPTKAEAAEIRAILGIPKRIELSEGQLANLREHAAANAFKPAEWPT